MNQLSWIEKMPASDLHTFSAVKTNIKLGMALSAIALLLFAATLIQNLFRVWPAAAVAASALGFFLLYRGAYGMRDNMRGLPRALQGQENRERKVLGIAEENMRPQ